MRFFVSYPIYASIIGVYSGYHEKVKNVLYVPDLGISLMSARRVCDAGLKGHFNSTLVYFKKDGRKIIKATLQDGLYIVNHIADGYEEIALPARVIKENQAKNSRKENLRYPATNKEKRAELEYYQLMHKRFNYLGPGKIRVLHKYTTLAKPVKIPENIPMCHVCAITKMRNSIPKELSSKKIGLLQLI